MSTALLKTISVAVLLGACTSTARNSKHQVSNDAVDATDTVQPVLATNATPQSLMDLPQSQYGGFVLKPGFYEAEFKTYCLQPGTPDPRPHDAYLQSAVTGPRKEIVETVLLNSTCNYSCGP
jgi:hypothetical protein